MDKIQQPRNVDEYVINIIIIVFYHNTLFKYIFKLTEKNSYRIFLFYINIKISERILILLFIFISDGQLEKTYSDARITWVRKINLS